MAPAGFEQSNVRLGYSEAVIEMMREAYRLAKAYEADRRVNIHFVFKNQDAGMLDVAETVLGLVHTLEIGVYLCPDRDIPTEKLLRFRGKYLFSNTPLTSITCTSPLEVLLTTPPHELAAIGGSVVGVTLTSFRGVAWIWNKFEDLRKKHALTSAEVKHAELSVKIQLMKEMNSILPKEYELNAARGPASVDKDSILALPSTVSVGNSEPSESTKADSPEQSSIEPVLIDEAGASLEGRTNSTIKANEESDEIALTVQKLETSLGRTADILDKLKDVQVFEPEPHTNLHRALLFAFAIRRPASSPKSLPSGEGDERRDELESSDR
jgi:hypothetical protein